jgi:hypothetical protein
MNKGVLYQIGTATEDYQGVISGLLFAITGAIVCWGSQKKPETHFYTLKLQPISPDASMRYAHFSKQQFKAETQVEAFQTAEMSNGKTLTLRPAYYPLTVENKVAGISLGKTTKPTEVVELWLDGEKQGFFDFHQNKYVLNDLASRSGVTIVSKASGNPVLVHNPETLGYLPETISQVQ